MKKEEVDKFIDEFLIFKGDIIEGTGRPIKFDLTEDERLDLFMITEMYSIDKNFTAHIRRSLSDYKELKRTELNL